MKKIILLFSLIMSSIHYSYADQFQIGFNAFAFLAVQNNIYVQIPLEEKSALMIEYYEGEEYLFFSDDTVESIGFSYKKYNKSIANGTFWRLGAGKYKETDDSVTDEGYSPIALYGTERKTSGGLIYGIEGGINATAAGSLSLFLGYQF